MHPNKEYAHDTIESFLLDADADPDSVLGKLKSKFPLCEDGSEVKKQRFFDTFDHKLYGKGLFLSREGRRYVLGDTSSEKPEAELSYRGRGQPKFWWDFPEGRLREKLRSCIDVRALLPLVSVERQINAYRVLNADEKTVSFLRLHEIRAIEGKGGNGKACVIAIEPVRGYEEDARRIAQYLSGLGLARAEDDILKISLESTGRAPGDYSSKINVTLEPDMAASDAVRKILLSLLDTIKMNVEGIVEDIDIEFLHDFRVAVRRTRSVLTLIKGVFPEKIQTRYKRDFAALGKKTNRLRDLDIYLLKKDQYAGMLPEELRPGLERLFAALQKERRQAHSEFVKYIDTASYRNVLESWEKFLNDPHKDDLPAENAGMPVLELADKHIRKRYKKVLKLGRKINDDSPESDLHTLRIECKKLRYFLEFFESLFPEKEIKQVIKQLKGLQDNLGDYNDLHVQQESLKSYISGLHSGTESEKEIIASAGGLISQLYRRHEEIRSEFNKKFDEFSNKETGALFEKLFSGN